MAITEFSEGRERKRVAIVGDLPVAADLKVFIDRGYEVLPYSDTNLTDHGDLSAADSVVFTQSAEKPGKILHDLDKYGRLLLDYDCRVYVRVARRPELQDRGRAIVVNSIATLKLPGAGLLPPERESLPAELREREGVTIAPFVYVCDLTMEWGDIARIIGDNPAGRAPSLDLQIYATRWDGREVTLSPEHQLLLRRAFWDCAVVRLRQMEDGLSGIPVYRAYVELAGGLFGKYPFPYFLKMGSRQKIATEYYKYQGNALMYIPFHLGPRLSIRRCGLGAQEGIIVGDLVEEAEALRDCACDGRAVSVIASLFGRTLRAWNHASAHSAQSIPQLLGHLFPQGIPDHREPLIRTLGATQSLDELRRLFELRNSAPVLAGPIHGDLHATNVLVRGTDAIVIDFEKSENGLPLLYDAASLEAGLLVDGFRTDERSNTDLMASIGPLYQGGAVLSWTAPHHPNDPSAWFYDCVRQIRIHGHHLECKPGQYGTALALALVKKACNPRVFDDQRERLRAIAYVLSERILTASVN